MMEHRFYLVSFRIQQERSKVVRVIADSKTRLTFACAAGRESCLVKGTHLLDGLGAEAPVTPCIAALAIHGWSGGRARIAELVVSCRK